MYIPYRKASVIRHPFTLDKSALTMTITLNSKPSTKMEHENLRAYGKAELAQLYSPGASRASALRLLNKYLHAADGLLDALQRTGYTRGSRHFTRYQVRLIFEAIGEP